MTKIILTVTHESGFWLGKFSKKKVGGASLFIINVYCGQKSRLLLKHKRVEASFLHFVNKDRLHLHLTSCRDI